VNSPVDRKRLADEVLAITQEMRAAAGENLWDELAGMEEERERLVAALFADLEPGSLATEEWVAVLHEASTHNETLVKMAASQRDRLARELLALRNARKAESVYARAMGAGES
jgi:hypothetical protein